MNSIKAIIFDAFGTLIDTGSGSIDAVSVLLRSQKRCDIDKREFYSKWKTYHTDIILSAESFVREEEAFRNALVRLYDEYSIDGNAYSDADILINTFDKRKLFPEVLDTVEYLKKHLLVCIGSNTDNYPLYQNLTNNGLCIEKVFTSESLGVYKPKTDFYTSILEDLQLSPAEVLFVGDSLIDDVYGPGKAGIKTCHINRKNTVYSDIIPDHAFTSLAGVAEILPCLRHKHPCGI